MAEDSEDPLSDTAATGSTDPAALSLALGGASPARTSPTRWKCGARR